MSSVRKLQQNDKWTDIQALRDSGFYAKFWSALLIISMIALIFSLKPPKTLLPVVQPLILSFHINDQPIEPTTQLISNERRLFANESDFTATEIVKTPDPPVQNEQIIKQEQEIKPVEKPKQIQTNPKEIVKPAPKKHKKSRDTQRQDLIQANAAPGAINVTQLPEATKAEASASSKSQALKILLAEIEKRKKYPKQARRTGAEGTVVMQVNINASGEIISCSIAKNCGIGALDLETDRLGKKLSGLNIGVRGAQFSIKVPIRYSLQ